MGFEWQVTSLTPEQQQALERLLQQINPVNPSDASLSSGFEQGEEAGWESFMDRANSWLYPVSDPVSRAIGAAIAGQNPFDVGRGGYFGDPRPVVSEALQARGAPTPLALLAELLTPDPFGAKKVKDLIPLLSVLLPMGLLRRMGQSTRVLDEAGLPRRVLHGTLKNFEDYNLEQATDSSMFGKGVYSTEGAYGPSELGTPNTMNPNRFRELATEKPQNLEDIELVSSLFANPEFSAAKRVGGQYNVQSGPFEPNVRLQYLMAQNPFNYTTVSSNPRQVFDSLAENTLSNFDPQIRSQITNKALDYLTEKNFSGQVEAARNFRKNTLGVQDVDGWSNAEITLALLEAMFEHSQAIKPGTTSPTVFQNLSRIAKGIESSGYDAIYHRGDVMGNLGMQGAGMWYVPDPAQVIPAGNVDLAVKKLSAYLRVPEEELFKLIGRTQ